AFRANGALLHLLITDVCPHPVQALALQAPAPANAPPVVGEATAKPRVASSCGIRRRGDEQDPFGGSEVGPMSKAALVAGLNAVRPQINECYLRHQVPGTAMVNVVIAKSGRVSKATVTGKFADTVTGACVEAAVKTAAAPPLRGVRSPYPFQLK